jgi:hypothetical protein
MIRTTVVLTFGLLLVTAMSLQAAQFSLEQDEDGITVKLNGKLFTRYVVKSGNKPIMWPIIGPYGNEITRAYPMREAAPDERADHPHHRSFWFTHGDVNGISVWHEGDGTGEIVHKEFVKVEAGDNPVIVTRNDWLGPDGKKLCEDVRTHTFGVDGESVWIDFDATVKASTSPVTFGDTKEGCFGVRVAGTMKVDAKQGGKIVNSEGHADREAWGKQAAWCDYHGPVKGNVVGVAIMNHPESFRFPTYWHVRTYGLFTANPFGLHNFTNAEKGAGSHTLQPGESFTLHYRLLIHKGDAKEGGVAEAFARYSKTKK